LTGTIPPDLSLLSFLVAFDVSKNYIIGDITADICNFQLALTVFSVAQYVLTPFYIKSRNSDLSGTLPSCFSNLANLTIINLVETMLKGKGFS
jgi:hypothetical protein